MQNIALAVAYEVRSLTLPQQAMSNDKSLCNTTRLSILNSEFGLGKRLKGKG
ncbi:hypothetical protein LC605_03145 [Nostoc sp. CHAB 5836]|uniref:hypothetical protein n=1 Tax=Nostoc sp. CHAB 5836 TaxID=2780404 RepID=UPI001E3F51E3|nr:hypothetical protein [Nostoc sp. CHAB 5836]MCC5614088.1 hypothetical protein [Nostoc sp. CHAB 5836]